MLPHFVTLPAPGGVRHPDKMTVVASHGSDLHFPFTPCDTLAASLEKLFFKPLTRFSC